jgi:DNA-binding XRE family transcriptional regulator
MLNTESRDYCGMMECGPVAEDAVAKTAAKREQLAERRKAVGLTQEQLAELLDVDRTTVARWERGETQPLPWLRPKLARALKVSPGRIEALLADPESARPGGAPSAAPAAGAAGAGCGRGEGRVSDGADGRGGFPASPDW